MKASTGRVNERHVQSEGTDGEIKDYARVQTGQSLWSSDPEDDEEWEDIWGRKTTPLKIGPEAYHNYYCILYI